MNLFKLIKLAIKSRREFKRHADDGYLGVVWPIFNGKYELWLHRTRKDIYGSKQIFWILYKVVGEKHYESS